jgi:hypothetical protein
LIFTHVLTETPIHVFNQDGNNDHESNDCLENLNSNLGYSTEEDELLMENVLTGERYNSALLGSYSLPSQSCSGRNMSSTSIDEFGIRHASEDPPTVDIEDSNVAVTLEEALFALNIDPVTMDHTFESEDTVYLDPNPEPLGDDLDVPPPDSHFIARAEEPDAHYEEVVDEQERCEVDRFPRAGEVKAPGKPRFQELAEKQISRTSDRNLFYPFKDQSDFELAKWLNPLPLTKIDKFLQLSYVSFLC